MACLLLLVPASQQRVSWLRTTLGHLAESGSGCGIPLPVPNSEELSIPNSRLGASVLLTLSPDAPRRAKPQTPLSADSLEIPSFSNRCEVSVNTGPPK